MIIKSMSRKKPTFQQLIEYLEKEDHTKSIYHNFYAPPRGAEALAFEFKKNAQLLPKRKN